MVEHKIDMIESRAYKMFEEWTNNLEDIGLQFVSQQSLGIQEKEQIMFKLTFIMKLYSLYTKG